MLTEVETTLEGDFGGAEVWTPMDAVITVVRFPLAIIATLLLLSIAWPVEFLLGALALPLKAITWNREQLKVRYGDWPFNVFATIRSVWYWVFVDERPSSRCYDGKDKPEGFGEFWSNIFER